MQKHYLQWDLFSIQYGIAVKKDDFFEETMMKQNKTTILKMTTQIIAILAIALAMSGCGSATADSEEDLISARPVKVMELKSAVMHKTITFPGKAKAKKEVNIAFRISGPLTELVVDDGMKFSKGDILARIDDRDFKVSAKTLEASLAASKAQYEEAILQFERYKSLLKTNAASKSAFDQRKAGYEMAKAQVEADTRRLESAQNALKDTVLYAPFDGYVHKLLVENHETVTQGQPVIWLVDISEMEVEIGIPESLLRRTADFNAFDCSFEALPGLTFETKLKEIGQKPNPSNSTYPLTLKIFTGTIDKIRPGMAASVNVYMNPSTLGDSFIIPSAAIVNKAADASYVWVLDPDKGHVEKRRVQPVQLNKAGVEVTGELSMGDFLVTAGAHHLTEGQQAKMLEPVSKTNVGNVL